MLVYNGLLYTDEEKIKVCINKLDVSVFNDENLYVSLGQLSQEMVNFILKKKPEFKDRLVINKDILFWKSRVVHTNNHKKDFVSTEEFIKCVEEIPSIIQYPDYISIHPTDESVSFIKKYSKYISVAIKISINGELVYRTMYPLSDNQLEGYIINHRAWKYE